MVLKRALCTLVATAMVGLTGCQYFNRKPEPIESVSSFKLPAKGDCPSLDMLEINQKWAEHASLEKVEEIYDAHLNDLLLEHVFPQMVPSQSIHNGLPNSYWVGVVSRSNQITRDQTSGDIKYSSPGCRAVGTVAIYLFPGEHPHFDFVKEIKSSERTEKALVKNPDRLAHSLLEVRWYDHSDQRRHRWYNFKLAKVAERKWSVKMKPLTLPFTINTLY